MDLSVPILPKRWRPLLKSWIAITVVVAVALTSFVWPMAKLEPREVPLGVAGPPQVVDAVEDRLSAQDGAFELHRYRDEAAAREAIRDRDVYGAAIASPQGTYILTAPAASPLVAQLLQQAVEPTQEAAGTQPGTRVVEVVPADPDDPRGTALGSLVLPLTLVSVLSALILMTTTRPGPVQITGLAGAALIAGAVAVTIVQGWLGVIEGPWLVNLLVISLAVLAICAAVAALTGTLARAGLALAAALMVFAGNPWSGVSTAPELMPTAVGAIGQLLPPGAAGSLLRSTAFFDGAGAGWPLAVLFTWAGLGMTGVALAARRRPCRTASPQHRPRPPGHPRADAGEGSVTPAGDALRSSSPWQANDLSTRGRRCRARGQR